LPSITSAGAAPESVNESRPEYRGGDQGDLALAVVSPLEHGAIGRNEHDHEHEEDKNSTDIDDDLDARQELGPKAEEDACDRKQGRGKEHGAVHGVLPRDHQDRRYDGDRREDIE
jgi:hypothetical protein